MRAAVLVALIAFLSAAPLKAEKRPMSLSDVFAIERIDRASVSPDGQLLAAVVIRPALPGEVYGRAAYEIDPSRGDVWIIDRSTGVRRYLTQGKARAAGAWCAIWSPDGQHLAFLSTRPEGAEPRGGDNVRLYVWNRQSDRVRRLNDRAVMTQTRYGGGLHRLDIAGPGATEPSACMKGDENPPFVWLDTHRLLVAALPPGRTSGLLDATEHVDRHIHATEEALRAGNEAVVSVSGSGAELTRAEPDERAILAIVDVQTDRWTSVASVPAYPFNGSLGMRVSPDGRRAAVLATVGAIAPRSDLPLVSNDGEWLVEKRLGFVDLASDRPVKWAALPADAKLPVMLVGWDGDGRSLVFKARAEPHDRTLSHFAMDPQTERVSTVSGPAKDVAPSRPAALPEKAELITSDGLGLVWKELTPQGTFIRAARPDGQEQRTLLALNRHLADIDLGRVISFPPILATRSLMAAFDPLRTLAKDGTQCRMLDPYMTKLARDWIAGFGSSDSDHEPDGKDNPFTLIDCVVKGDPLYAWHLIMQIVKLDTEGRSLPLLASSHVERFLELHGDAMIDYIEEDIEQSPKMREMLWCVRQMGTPDRVRARIETLKSAEPPAT